jgi:Flp pilus assembly secretin CpaC
MRGCGVMMAGTSSSSASKFAMAVKLKQLLLVTMLLVAGVPAGLCQDRAVTLRLGTPVWLTLDGTLDTVIIGDREIVDVKTGDNQSVLIEPLRPGETNLVFVDARGRVIANVRVSVCGVSDVCQAAAGGI